MIHMSNTDAIALHTSILRNAEARLAEACHGDVAGYWAAVRRFEEAERSLTRCRIERGLA